MIYRRLGFFGKANWASSAGPFAPFNHCINWLTPQWPAESCSKNNHDPTTAFAVTRFGDADCNCNGDDWTTRDKPTGRWETYKGRTRRKRRPREKKAKVLVIVVEQHRFGIIVSAAATALCLSPDSLFPAFPLLRFLPRLRLGYSMARSCCYGYYKYFYGSCSGAARSRVVRRRQHWQLVAGKGALNPS